MRNQIQRPLSNDDLQSLAPAIFALNPMEDVSDRYTFIPTIDVINALRDSGWVPVFARQAGVRKIERDGYQRHMIRFQKSGLDITNEENLNMVLYNSHDRGCAFNLSASVWRKICGNGLMVESDIASFAHRHVGFNMDELIDSAQKIANSATVISANVESLKTIDLSPDEKGAFAFAAHNLVYGDETEKAPILPYQLLNHRRYDDKGDELWTTFNVVQENIIKGGLPGKKTPKGRRTKTRKVQSIQRDIKLNKALWTLTERMKELKTGQKAA